MSFFLNIPCVGLSLWSSCILQLNTNQVVLESYEDGFQEMEEKIPKVKNNPLGDKKCLTAGYPLSIFQIWGLN